jgi:hypothetical protein
MIFMMFDIEIIFLYPYTRSTGARHVRVRGDRRVQRSRSSPRSSMSSRNGALDWGPASGTAVSTSSVSTRATTTRTTIRRVGLEGRLDGDDVGAGHHDHPEEAA